jgi:starch phosphorylase
MNLRDGDARASLAAFAPGAAELAARAELLAERLSDGLKPLAQVAYNYAWSWLPDGDAVFRAINPHRWELSGANPVSFLNELWPSTQEAVEHNPELLARIDALADTMSGYLARPERPRAGIDGPVAFFCAEFGVHASLPLYSGGLGVLAADIIKEASDQALPMIGIGLFYRLGYFRQRIDLHGRQQEYWVVSDPESLPMARVRDATGRPLLLSVELSGQAMAFQVWRVDVGRVPLLLLDTELPQNDPVPRWTSARLYESNRALRLAQYGLLGIGGARVLHALAIEPGAIHLNEGHPALAPLELAARRVEAGASFDDALEQVRRRVVFTTHTPVPAGNETYAADEFLRVFADLPRRLGIDDDAFLDLCRITPGDAAERPGMTTLAIRVSARRNGVSRLHGEVARRIWQPLFHGDAADVPIGHVTNGAHLPTFLGGPMRRLLTRYLGEGWLARAGEAATWLPVRAIPNDELWAVRCESRERLLAFARERSQQDGLRRGEEIEAVRAVARQLDPSALTLGFARRLATYKRLHLLTLDPERAHRVLGGDRAVQLLVAGKAHPADDPGKETLQRLIRFKQDDPSLADRVVFVDDYDLDIARRLVSGCDVWVNLPRRPMEASGTSGMKAAFNGVLQLSVLDGWWAEAYDGTNGWAIEGGESEDFDSADAHDATRLYDLLEHEVIPLFYDRDENGVPQGWCERVKTSLLSCAPAFTATRMVDDYAARMYPSEPS